MLRRRIEEYNEDRTKYTVMWNQHYFEIMPILDETRVIPDIKTIVI